MQKENKMGVMPIRKLVLSMSLPMMLSMLVQALYNVVDSIFVAKVCEDALTAVSLAFAMQNLMIAVATGTGVGVNALLSRSLGTKDFEKANKIAVNGVFLALASSVVFLLFGFFGTKLFFETQIASDTAIFSYGVDYLSIVSIFSFGVFGQVIMERLMQSTGKTTLSMATQLFGAIINIVLDPLLILGIGFFPRMEAKGAAVATVIGQICSFGLGIILNHKFNKEIHIHIKGFKPSGRIIADIYKIGLPSIIMVAIGSIMTYCFNKILLAFTTTAVAVFGVYFKLQSFIFMPVFGLNNGVIPIIAYNYGAKKRDRITKTLKFSTGIAVVIMILGTLLMWLIPEQMLRLFDATEDMMSIGVPALRIISMSFIFAGVSINLGSIFQALGKSQYSMYSSIARQLIILIPTAYFLSKLGNVDYVWYSFPISEVGSLILNIVFFSVVHKSVIKNLPVAHHDEIETTESQN